MPELVKFPRDKTEILDGEAPKKICPITPTKEGIEMRREKYIDALIQGDASLKRYFNTQDEMKENRYPPDNTPLVAGTCSEIICITNHEDPQVLDESPRCHYSVWLA